MDAAIVQFTVAWWAGKQGADAFVTGPAAASRALWPVAPASRRGRRSRSAAIRQPDAHTIAPACERSRLIALRNSCLRAIFRGRAFFAFARVAFTGESRIPVANWPAVATWAQGDVPRLNIAWPRSSVRCHRDAEPSLPFGRASIAARYSELGDMAIRHRGTPLDMGNPHTGLTTSKPIPLATVSPIHTSVAQLLRARRLPRPLSIAHWI